jgi:hypothetical protein
MRVGDPAEAIDVVRESIERMQAGASIQSAPNTIRNIVVLLDRQSRLDLAAPLVSWLNASPMGIPGTPGMRRDAELTT